MFSESSVVVTFLIRENFVWKHFESKYLCFISIPGTHSTTLMQWKPPALQQGYTSDHCPLEEDSPLSGTPGVQKTIWWFAHHLYPLFKAKLWKAETPGWGLNKSPCNSEKDDLSYMENDSSALPSSLQIAFFLLFIFVVLPNERRYWQFIHRSRFSFQLSHQDQCLFNWSLQIKQSS